MPLVHTTRLADAYRRFLQSSDPLAFVADVDEHYSASTLCRLLTAGDAESRRASALALGTLGDRGSLEPLGRALSDPDRGVRLVADDSLRGRLIRDAAPAHHQQLLHAMHRIDGDAHAAALPMLIRLCEAAPLYAEAHHQLAICWHALDDPATASRAYAACLWRCRYHYAAWNGLGRCRLALGEPHRALRHIGRAVEVMPDFELGRVAIRSIRRALRRRGTNDAGPTV